MDASPVIEEERSSRKNLPPLRTTEGPSPWAGVLLSDQEALQIIAVLADVHDGHDVRDAVGAAWSLLSTGWAPTQGLPSLAPSVQGHGRTHRELGKHPRTVPIGLILQLGGHRHRPWFVRG
jgi:hypothetical protein